MRAVLFQQSLTRRNTQRLRVRKSTIACENALQSYIGWFCILETQLRIGHGQAAMQAQPDRLPVVTDHGTATVNPLNTGQTIVDTVAANITFLELAGEQIVTVHLQHMIRSHKPQGAAHILCQSKNRLAQGLRQIGWNMQLTGLQIGEPFGCPDSEHPHCVFKNSAHVRGRQSMAGQEGLPSACTVFV